MPRTLPERDHGSTAWRWSFAVALALLIVLGVLAAREYVRFTRATDAVDHAYQVMQSIDRVVLTLVGAEAGHRGYLLTTDRAFLAPYEGAEATVRTELAELESRLAADAEQRQAVVRLEVLADEALREMAEARRRLEAGDAVGAMARIVEANGPHVLDEVRTVGDQMRVTEQSALADRAAEARRARQAALALSAATTLVALVLGMLAFSINRAFESRGRALAAEAVARFERAEEERAALLASERAARSEAERAARLKDDFVSTLSHELRTPLNAILGWVGVLKIDRRPETLAKAIDVLDRNSRRQSQMIDDLLDVGRIISGKLRLDVQPVNLASVVEEAVTSARPAADAKGVRLSQVLGSAGTIQGDPGRLQQVVWNLLSNAIKFTPRGGQVQVTLSKVKSQVTIQVLDSGIGIRPELLPHVFQRFRQGDVSSTRRQGGLGLGLAIVKNLVEMHGGSVEAASDGEGAGSVFTVRLPLAPARARPGDSLEALDLVPAEFAALLAGVQVLVLDDEADAREIVQRLLEDSGATVVTAGSAHDALDQLTHGLLPDVIVSDIGMPDQDGYEFMQRVRRLGGPLSSVPAAALTALARLEDRKRALMAGYQSHLAKPVDPTELVAMVASMTGRTGRG